MSGSSFFRCKVKKCDSLVWKSILSAKNIVRIGTCFKVGDGWSINPWSDPGFLGSLGKMWRNEMMVTG